MKSLGTKLTVGKTNPVEVAKLTSINGVELTRETSDVTALDSEDGYREYEGSWKDGGEVSIEGYLVLEEGKGQKEIYDLFESNEVQDFSIVYPTTIDAHWDFKGLVTGFSTSADLEDPLGFSATIKTSGKPVLVIGAQG
jgi:predicted secreted protein